MTHAVDLHQVGVSYKVYDKSKNANYVKTIYVVSYDDVLDCAGTFTSEYETVAEYTNWVLARFSNFYEASRVYWYITAKEDFSVEDAAYDAIHEDKDIIIVEYIEDTKDSRLTTSIKEMIDDWNRGN